MTSKPDADETHLLQRWQEGEERAADELMPLVYDELRRLARRHLRNERSDHTLSTTAPVHEAYLNLDAGRNSSWQSRAHFFHIASRTMRRVLIWYARRRNAQKRGGGVRNLSLESVAIVSDDRIEELLELDQALEQLEQLDVRLCRVVECRYFAGLTVRETSEALRISEAAVKRDWQTARAWLRTALNPPE